MGTLPQFALQRLRKGKRKDYPDYFITIEQKEGFSATISRERNGMITIHYHDGGYLSFDTQHVDSFDQLKLSDLGKLNLLKISISTSDFLGEMSSLLSNVPSEEVTNLEELLKGCLELSFDAPESNGSYRWFTELLNSEQEQQYLREHLATVRYFHGDFDPLKEFLIEDMSNGTEEGDSFFEDTDETEEGSFFEEDDDLNFEE